MEIINQRLQAKYRTLEKNGKRVKLTQVEYSIVKLFMENPGRVFTKQQIFEAGWEETYMVSDNNVMVCIFQAARQAGAGWQGVYSNHQRAGISDGKRVRTAENEK